jgi:hypothetical protein
MSLITTYTGNEYKDLKGLEVKVVRVLRGQGDDMAFLDLEEGTKPLPTDRLDIRFRTTGTLSGWSLSLVEVSPADLAAFAEVTEAA